MTVRWLVVHCAHERRFSCSLIMRRANDSGKKDSKSISIDGCKLDETFQSMECMDKIFSSSIDCDGVLESSMDWMVVFAPWNSVLAMDVF